MPVTNIGIHPMPGRRHYLNATLIKSYMYQLLKSLDHMHRKGIFHRFGPFNVQISGFSCRIIL